MYNTQETVFSSRHWQVISEDAVWLDEDTLFYGLKGPVKDGLSIVFMCTTTKRLCSG